jgi:hypothetical protein
MTRRETQGRLLYWAGLAIGPLAWGINLQAIYAVAHFSCEKTGFAGAAISAISAIAALAGAGISARAARRSAGVEWSDTQGGGPLTFMAWIGIGSGVLFALVIANQLAASLMISPCLR